MARSMMDATVPVDAPVVTDRGTESEWRGTWGQFCLDNGETMDDEYLSVIAADLSRGLVFRDGGGAAAEWTIEVFRS